MHQRGLCLCPDCHGQDARREDEQRHVATVWIAAMRERRVSTPRGRIVNAPDIKMDSRT